MLRGKVALVVDDDNGWLERTCAVMASLGFTVVTATSGREAGYLINRNDFDLLVTDNFMEFSDAGIDLLLYNYYMEQELPSILYTSEVTREQEERLRKELPQVICVKKSTKNDNAELTAAIQKLVPN